MADSLYDLARASFLGAAPAIDWDADTIKVSLVRGYTANLATHQYVADVTTAGGTIVATTAALTGKTTTAGVADADDVTFTAVTAGAACQHLVIFKDTGSAATSPLIALLDSATGLPFTPNGGDLAVSWANTSNKIFKL